MRLGIVWARSFCGEDWVFSINVYDQERHLWTSRGHYGRTALGALWHYIRNHRGSLTKGSSAYR